MKELALDRTRVTDDGLLNLRGLAALQWMFLYPLWIVHSRDRLPRLPRRRTVFAEALFAMLGTAVVMVVLAAVFSALFYLFGDRATTTMPFKPIAASPNWYDSLGLL